MDGEQSLTGWQGWWGDTLGDLEKAVQSAAMQEGTSRLRGKAKGVGPPCESLYGQDGKKKSHILT